MGRQAPKVWLSAEQQDELERFARSRTLAARCVERARILLGCAAGRENQQIGEELGVCRQTVGRWRERFVAQGMEGLEDRPRSGTARTHPASQSFPFGGLGRRRLPIVAAVASGLLCREKI